MSFLNPYVIAGAIGLLLASFIGGGFLGWHEKSIRVPAELQSQEVVDALECSKAQQLTKVENDQLQKDRDGIADKLSTLQLQQPPTCVRVASSPDISNSGAKHAGQDGNGISSIWLRKYAAEAEQYRSEVTVCNDFLAEERKVNQK